MFDFVIFVTNILWSFLWKGGKGTQLRSFPLPPFLAKHGGIGIPDSDCVTSQGRRSRGFPPNSLAERTQRMRAFPVFASTRLGPPTRLSLACNAIRSWNADLSLLSRILWQ